MRCFGYMSSEFDNILCKRVLGVIQELKYYFVRFNNSSADLAMQRTLHHALLHYQDDGDLVPYIKKLARTIMINNDKTVPSEFMEATIVDTAEDIVTTVLDKVLEGSFINKIHSMVVGYMHYFLVLCESIKSQNSLTSYFPSEFKRECNRLAKLDSNFVPLCLDIYDKYGQEIRDFLECETLERTWRETDYSSLELYASKRVKFVDKRGTVLDIDKCMQSDLDTEDLYIVGKLANKRIVKIQYDEVWDTMCELIDSDKNNEMKFTVGSTTTIRTLGGSWSVLNPVLDHEYELCLDEIVTNLIIATKGRYLGRGIRYMYFLVEEVLEIEPKIAMRQVLEFEEIDITDTVKIYNK